MPRTNWALVKITASELHEVKALRGQERAVFHLCMSVQIVGGVFLTNQWTRKGVFLQRVYNSRCTCQQSSFYTVCIENTVFVSVLQVSCIGKSLSSAR